MNSDDRLDGLFLTVVQQCPNGIEELMDRFFGFLQRRTDFFSGIRNVDDSDHVVLSSLQKAKEKWREDLDSKRGQPKSDNCARKPSENVVPKKNQPEEKNTTDKKETGPASSAALVGNGSSTDRYSWTQSLPTVEVVVPLDGPATSKDCTIVITKNHLRVVAFGEVIIDADTFDAVAVDDSLWTIDNKTTIQITLEKVHQMKWWAYLLQGETPIDTTKCVPENSRLGDLDPQTRQTVEKMLLEQQAKASAACGATPQHEMFRKFQEAHPHMDFSEAKINLGV